MRNWKLRLLTEDDLCWLFAKFGPTVAAVAVTGIVILIISLFTYAIVEGPPHPRTVIIQYPTGQR